MLWNGDDHMHLCVHTLSISICTPTRSHLPMLTFSHSRTLVYTYNPTHPPPPPPTPTQTHSQVGLFAKPMAGAFEFASKTATGVGGGIRNLGEDVIRQQPQRVRPPRILGNVSTGMCLCVCKCVCVPFLFFGLLWWVFCGCFVGVLCCNLLPSPSLPLL